MNLVIDCVGNKHSGGAQVLVQILDAVVANEFISRVTLFASPSRYRQFNLPTSAKFIVENIESTEGAVRRLWWALYGLEQCLGATPHDVFLGMNGFGPRERRTPSVLFIQQSLPYSTEALAHCPLAERMRMGVIRGLTKRAASRAAHVMVQSDPMRSLLVKAFGISSDMVSVHMPSAPQSPETIGELPEKLLQMQGTKRNCILYIGNQSAYKNLPVINAAMQQPELSQVAWFATLPASHALVTGGHARALGNLNASELAHAYALAGVVVLPSFTETVGLPMLEAMRAGTPVLAADRPYAHAVCEDAALFFDPNSPADLAQKAARLLNDRALRDDLVRRAYALITRRDQADVYGGMVRKLVEVAKAHAGVRR